MKRYIFRLFNLRYGEEAKEKTLENVRSNISFSGANLWILACAIMVASVGLNVNSTAVVIGAMLISPLMGPIVASGFALGIYDFPLLRSASKNLLIATVVGLIVSTLYFYLSPFKAVQSELLARTAPNIYDILIAFFGGLVGVIAVTRVEKGNPIPGVAIATALMPPLCTAGYGLATGNYRFFLGAMFLYSINCVFICIATYLIVKLLKYPTKEIVDNKYQKLVRYGLTALIVVMLVPSLLFALSLFKQQQFDEAINNFIDENFANKGYTIIFKKTNYNSSPKSVELAFLSKQFSQKEIAGLNATLKSGGLDNTELVIRQNENLNNLKSDILNEITKSESVLTEKDKRIKALETELQNSVIDTKPIFAECKILFPTIESLSISKQTRYLSDETSIEEISLIYGAKKELSEEDKTKLSEWISKKLEIQGLKIFWLKIAEPKPEAKEVSSAN
jgi:uncharacterized hydrophobic protein (TIGR00271 family)